MITDQEKRDMFAAAIVQGWAASGQVSLYHEDTINNVFEVADKMVKVSNDFQFSKEINEL